MEFINTFNWWDDKYRSNLGCRFSTMKSALNLFRQRGGTTIVETGTTRQFDDWGAGQSTLVFGDYLSRYGGQLYTCDINSTNIATCKAVTKEYEDNITYVVDDSLNFLNEFPIKYNKPIDLLYLDSMDCEPEAALIAAQKHNLEEFKIIEDYLHEDSIVLIDDSGFKNGGKTILTRQYMFDSGKWEFILDFQQTLAIRKK